jgi:hypothetical protein
VVLDDLAVVGEAPALTNRKAATNIVFIGLRAVLLSIET